MSRSLPLQLTSLLQPGAYPHEVAGVRLVETHISWVFLTGQFAYKIKRPVRYSFVDLRSPEQRAFFCREELRLNRRFAAELYLDVCAVTLEGGTARMSGTGAVLDHAVRMREFRSEDELDRLLDRGGVAPQELAAFGRELAQLHGRLPVAAADEEWGQPHTVRAALWRNFEECLQATESLAAQDKVRALSQPYGARLDDAAPWLASRRASGKVRECHGDLHARNVVRYGGHLVPFDCMEFEPAFRWIDVAEEIAFLFMDLQARSCADHAQAFIGGYLCESGDYQACRLLRVYATHGALVRAKVAGLLAGEQTASARAPALREQASYLECARRILAPDRPLLILTCGMPGSGKTWLAERLAPRLGAVHLRSDVERKRIAGLAERQRSGSAPGERLYSTTMTDETYQRLYQCAKDVIAGGFTAVVDATFSQRRHRARLSELAAELDVSMYVILCNAPNAVLQARVAARAQAAADASEADLAVLEWERGRFEPIRAAENLQVIDADTTTAAVVSRVLEVVERNGSLER